MDALLYEPAFAAVGALEDVSKKKTPKSNNHSNTGVFYHRHFNTGVMVIEPSVATASALFRLSHERHRPWGRNQPEPWHDGTTINNYYRLYSRWRSLPIGYNMNRRILLTNRTLWNRTEIAVVRITYMIISRAYTDDDDDDDDDLWRDYANRCTISGSPSRGRP